MIPLLIAEAQMPVTAIEIGVFIGCATFLLGAYRNWMGIQADRVRMKAGTKEQPVELAHPITIKSLETPAMKSDVDEVETEVEGVNTALSELRVHIDAKFDQQRVQASQRMRELQRSFSEDVQKLKAEIEHRISEVRNQLAQGITAATDKADEALRENCGHKAEIDHLKGADYQHTVGIQAVNHRIDNLPTKGGK
ncbi:MAG: hypothetical protein V4662_11985 [Verrucomicrobiota bacterium]